MMFYSNEEDNRYDMRENPGPDDMMKPLKKAIWSNIPNRILDQTAKIIPNESNIL